MSGWATLLPASRRANHCERRLGRGKIGSNVFELEREATCTWAAPGSGSAAGSTSPLRPPRWCPLGRRATHERGALDCRASPQVRSSGGPGCCAVASPSHPSHVLRLRLRHRPSNSAALTLYHAPPRLRLARLPGRALCGSVLLALPIICGHNLICLSKQYNISLVAAAGKHS